MPKPPASAAGAGISGSGIETGGNVARSGSVTVVSLAANGLANGDAPNEGDANEPPSPPNDGAELAAAGSGSA